MTSTGLILAFFGDADAAQSAFQDLRRAGYRQIALLSKKPDGKLSVVTPDSVAPYFALGGAALGLAVGKLLPIPRGAAPVVSQILPLAGGNLGAVAGYFAGTLREQELPARDIERYKNSVLSGETLLIARAPSQFQSDALKIMRGASEHGPATFVERPAALPVDISKSPLRSEVLSLEQLRDFGLELGAKHKSTQKGGGQFLLARLKQNQKIIARVVRGLGEAAKLEQAVSLSAEWLLDNNYIIQGQIADVRRNLSPQFYKQLPVLKDGKYLGVARVYLMASELVASSDSRLDRERILEFVHAYQNGGAPLTTGELWALPLMIRLALVENLRRLTAQADRRQRERERADFWANRLLTAAFKDADAILPLLAQLSKEQRQIAAHFADRLVSHLFDEEAALGPVRAWLERKMNSPLAEITSREQRRQAADSISVGNVITSLRFLSNLDWRECFEEVSLVDQILSQDPAGVYRSMDFATRDRYRGQVEKLARGAKIDELEVAHKAVKAAAEDNLSRVQSAAPAHGEREHELLIYQPSGHVGYYLVDDGRRDFASALGYRRTLLSRFRRWVHQNPNTWYFAGMGAATIAAQWGLGRFARSVGGVLPWPLRLLALVPASEIAAQVVNYSATRLLPPRPLGKMEFKDGVPERWKTVVVIPMLLGSVADASEGARQLELHFLANSDANLRFALLADYTDASEKHRSDDAEKFEEARRSIDYLNVRYGQINGQDRFHLFIRDRKWSETENRWMGWERKRGKLEEFNAFLLGQRLDDGERLHPGAANPDGLRDIRFVVTLDADTQLPYGSAIRLVETLAHPLNRPVISTKNEGNQKLVERGYSIIQPRVDTMLPSAMATRFSRLFTGAAGSDPYTNVVSDVYQDAFGEGSYHGKGIYDLEAFERVLGDRFPDATLLSHDLIEGAHVRAGVASDIVLLDKFPPTYRAAAKRDHRWIRGDWQIAEYIGSTVTTRRGREVNPLSLLNKWKIADNLRRSLLAPACVTMLVGGWLLGPTAALTASVGVAGLLLWPTAINVFTRLTSQPESLVRGRHEIRRGLLRASIETSLMLHRAGLCLDAIARVLYRQNVSHQLMLEWQSAASTYRGATSEDAGFSFKLALGSAFSGVVALLLWRAGGGALVAASPYLVAWAASPLVAKWLSGGREIGFQAPLELEDARYLRGVARETWRYFDDFVGPQTNWLPPDNYQEALNVEIAQRTSPTNMGLWLLACVAAGDFGWLTFDEVVARSLATLQTFEDLEKHEGHFLNWYGSLTLEPLRPRYVSTVDSGNLLGSLWTLARSMKEMSRSPLITDAGILGLSDTLDTLENALGDAKKNFVAEIGEVRRIIEAPRTSVVQLVAAIHALEKPIGDLSRAITSRPVVLKTSARSRSDLNSAASDPRTAVSSPAYWAAQLETQLDLWLQSLNRYARWIEILGQHPDEWLLSLGSDAAEMRRAILNNVPSLTELSRGDLNTLRDLLNRRHEDRVPSEVRDWAQKISDEFDRARWLAGEMMASCEGVIDRSRGLADAMKMGFLFDAERKLFSIGYSVEEHRLDASYYDLLASECRLASFCAIARGDVPASHWLALGRRFGETSVGPALMSWSGTMFEYLMPILFQQAFENSLLERAVKVAVGAQIAYGKRRNVPWGISEAAFSAIDANRIYQYKAFGVPGLGLKRGLEDDLVVAPYASLMALMIEREAAIENLKRLETLGMRGDYGFYESIDFTRERLEEDSIVATGAGEIAKVGGRLASQAQKGTIVRCFMVHHQGMALLSLQNVLLDGAVQRRFHSDVFVQAAAPLLFEKIPEAPPVLEDQNMDNARPSRVEAAGAPVERTQTPDTPAPRSHLLGSERYGVMLTAAGGGFSRWHDTEITRWRSDTTRDNWGQFLYLRDLETGVSWSATHQPLKRAARRAGVSFKAEKVEFDRRDAEIETKLEVCVSPEDDAEVRRVTLINHSNRARKIELTTYAELSLAPHATDRAHPSFNKLFIQTALVPDRDALLAWRRLRQPKDAPVWAAHWMSSPQNADEIQFETDRSRFLGRARSAENPVAMETDLSGTVGAVLDPIFSLRRRVTLHPGQRLQVAFITGAAESEEKIHQMVEKYADFSSCERAFDLAWTHSQLELHHLRVQADEAQAFQQLAGYLLYPHAALRAPARRVRENIKNQSGLWSYGISGDLPILLVAIDNARDLPTVRQALMAHTFWRVRGFKCDLVIINEQAGGYNQDLTAALKALIDGSTPYTGIDKPGGVFLRGGDSIPAEDMTLLFAVARAVLIAARGSIAQQLGLINDDLELAPRFAATSKETVDASLSLPFLELPYFNGLGGFTGDGKEYAIYLGPKDRTPAPWINVFAHEHFGALTSESGQGMAWYGNSQSNRIIPWNNDPVSDTPSEAIYIRDEETGAFWSPTPLPIRDNEAYRARHGQGYSSFEHNCRGIEQELTTFVPMDGKNRPVRVQKLRLKNRTNRRRRLSVSFFVDLVLGTTREENQMQIVTSWDTVSSTLLARNAYHPDFGSRIAFASATPKPQTHSGDRTAFLGRNGSAANPAAMRRKTVTEKTGANLDPCAALQVWIELGPGEETSVNFLLGEAGDVDEVRSIVAAFRDNASIDRSLATTKNWWNDVLDTLQVDVPDQSINFLLNRWLPYQTLCCRIWARSALYQSGGAWGFRDQLQDSLALTTLYPQAARDQILRSAAHQFEEGDVQHWWHPPGDAGVRTLITDDLLFLPYAVAQYLKVTGDDSVLGEEVPFLHADILKEGEHEKYFQPQISPESGTIFEHCRRAIEKGCTSGINGLPLIGGGDWNDGLNRVGIEGKGESVWLAWFCVEVLNTFAEVCAKTGEKELAKTYRARAKKYVQNIDKNAWDGEYYRRGYFDDGTPLGSASSEEAKIDSLPQSWSIIAGGGDKARAEQAMRSLEEHLIKKDDKLVLLFTPAFDKTHNDPGYIKGYLPGVRENGGQYTHAACWVAYAYARGGFGNKAVEVLSLLNPVNHSRTPEDVNKYKVEPYVVAADVYNLEGQVGRGGWTWYTGSCGWMYRVWVEEVLGFKKRGEKLLIDPAIPDYWPGFSLKYRHGAAIYQIEVRNPDGVERGVARIEVDGKLIRTTEIPLKDDGATHQVIVTLGMKAKKVESSEAGESPDPTKNEAEA
ncbi:cyclic beta-1,2-glucan synthetase [Abditibacterium utsteinense]|uniref:Cyclic beta-1,2-glucan synthetase n=1 Tax=Abditibacterium utsteinense TaxID=1960156 RepID=A0A2S8SX97_9BACT|nr:glucoamylase family protein [Abditibacterium utsteinense]PQV65427.1 cyclic beta-1,2-glucan synthetase [Abditibacterium utsteinense]